MEATDNPRALRWLDASTAFAITKGVRKRRVEELITIYYARRCISEYIPQEQGVEPRAVTA